jgi:hypothetical protein
MARCPAKSSLGARCTLEEGHGRHVFDKAPENEPPARFDPERPTQKLQQCPVLLMSSRPRLRCLLKAEHGAHVWESLQVGEYQPQERAAPPALPSATGEAAMQAPLPRSPMATAAPRYIPSRNFRTPTLPLPSPSQQQPAARLATATPPTPPRSAAVSVPVGNAMQPATPSQGGTAVPTEHPVHPPLPSNPE